MYFTDGGPWLTAGKLWGLALALLVTWVLADDHDSTVATDDLALVANLLDAWVNLHVSYFLLGVLVEPGGHNHQSW